MKKLIIVLSIISMCFSTQIYAQSRDNGSIIYKWTEDGQAHYGRVLPQGISEYSTVDLRNMSVNQHSTATANSKPTKNTNNIITKEQRCEMAKKSIEQLSTQENLFLEDENKNLIPLTAEEKAKKLAEARQSADAFCK